MKKNKKMFRFILVFVALIAILFPSYSKASSDIQIDDSVEVADVDLSWKAIKDGADTFIKKGEKTGSVDDKKVHYEDMVEPSIQALRKIGVDGMIIIGGDGTLDSARVIEEHGMQTIGVPKTIDNDMIASNPTIGFQTAVENAVEAIRKVKTTAYSHRRVMVVEMMGRTSGYLTLYGGFAAGADIILLPELEYDLDAVCEKVKEIMDGGKRYVIVAASEAAKEKG